MSRYPLINPRFPHFIHGADYNPDQWPEPVWDEDVRLMRLAGCNAMTLPVFSWTQLEPDDGVYTFDWLDRIIDKLWSNGVHLVLATPSAAIPAWLAQKYPEVLRARHDGQRFPQRVRVNFCLTSPVYRDKCAAMARRLAERYGNHPGLLVWHISNEYHNDCHCDLCREAFRGWLQECYASLDELNQAWWTAFWSHTYTDWSQIEPPQPWPHGEWSIHGLTMDWRRFTGHQHLQCFLNEKAALREVTPDVPVTTNMHALLREDAFTCWRPFAEHVDVIAWDNYPRYEDRPEDVDRAVFTAFSADVYRSFRGGQPFMMMESNPSAGAGQRQQRPGVLQRTCLQAIGHGGDTVQYFQWRNGRGCVEQYHGAIVEHVGHERTRQFGEVAEIGALLPKLEPVLGSSVESEVAVIWDEENHWALELSSTARHDERDYVDTCLRHYRAFWRRGIPTDVIPMDAPLDRYRLVVAPVLYMLREGVAERIADFVRKGGTFVTTYWSGYVDRHVRTFEGGFPGPLREICGVWSEELDALHPDETNPVLPLEGNALNLSETFYARRFCDVLHLEGAQSLAAFGGMYYAGRPALTVNRYGDGQAWYIGFLDDGDFSDRFYGQLVEQLEIHPTIRTPLPEGVTVQVRSDGERDYLFIHNFSGKAVDLPLDDAAYADPLSGEPVAETLHLERIDSRVLARPARKR